MATETVTLLDDDSVVAIVADDAVISIGATKSTASLQANLAQVSALVATHEAEITALQVDKDSEESAWTVATSTVVAGSGSLTSASCTIRFKKNGKTVLFNIVVNITTNGTGATSLQITLPFIALSELVVNGRGTAVSGKMTQGLVVAGQSSMSIFNYDNTYPGASGERISMQGVCEVV